MQDRTNIGLGLGLVFILGIFVGWQMSDLKKVSREVLEERIEWMNCGVERGTDECKQHFGDCFTELYGDDIKKLLEER